MNNAERWPGYGRTSGMRCVIAWAERPWMALAPFRSDRVPFADSNSQQHCSTAPKPARPISPADIRIHFSTDEKKPVFSDRFLKMVGERGLHCSMSSALRAVAEATLSRFARLKPPSEVLILFYTDEKKPVFSDRFLKMVGERGFEPPTHWSQTSCATKLRYSPIFLTVLPGAKRGT